VGGAGRNCIKYQQVAGLQDMWESLLTRVSALALSFAYPHWLIVAGVVVLMLGLIGFALFGQRDVDNTELDDGPDLSDKGAP
jgi:sensor domain CHASE-containing protein